MRESEGNKVEWRDSPKERRLLGSRSAKEENLLADWGGRRCRNPREENDGDAVGPSDVEPLKRGGGDHGRDSMAAEKHENVNTRQHGTKHFHPGI